MEGRRGILTHFGGTIRLVILIILIALTTFFVVRWVRARQHTKVAQQAATGLQQKDNSSDTKNPSDNTTQDGDTSTAPSSPTVEVPGGIAESEVTGSTANQNVPSVGMGVDTFLTVVILSLTGYVGGIYLQSRNRISKVK